MLNTCRKGSVLARCVVLSDNRFSIFFHAASASNSVVGAVSTCTIVFCSMSNSALLAFWYAIKAIFSRSASGSPAKYLPSISSISIKFFISLLRLI